MKNQIKEFMNSLPPEYDEFVDSIVKLHEIKDGLVDALEKYGDHLGCCYINLNMGDCNCGYDKALKQAENEG